MDLIRSTIKALLYDYPVEAVANHIINGNNRRPDDFYNRLKELLVWREKGFSTTEISLLDNILENEWLVDNTVSFDKDAPYHPYERIFILIEHCANQLIHLIKNIPKVRIRHLLRWRELTLLVGEDNLILPFLAKSDILLNKKRQSFLWPNILDHDDLQLNAILDETLSDTHFHLNAGCDVFEFNWIIIMNHIEALNSNIPGFMDIGEMRDYDPVKRFSNLNLSLKNWIAIAAFIRAQLTTLIENDTFQIECDLSTDVIFDEKNMRLLSLKTRRLIEHYNRKSLKTSNNIIFDYAITTENTSELTDNEISDVYMAHHGERQLLYNYFKKYYGGGESARRFAPYIYLYLLIKNKMRRELIQTNGLRGFENFQIYQNYKQYFFHHTHDLVAITETAYRYAVQSAVGELKKHHVEARVTPGSIQYYQRLDFSISIFGRKKIIDDNSNLLTLVCHFIKSEDTQKTKDERCLRHEKFRKQLKTNLKKIIKIWQLNNVINGHPKFVGIDAASNELLCRPEVFAPIYRQARTYGITNCTYHVGEDFYDILDGLRAIDEAIKFLGLTTGSRIGHALVLGTNVSKYYKSRRNFIIIPKQVLLDNLIWMKFKSMVFNLNLSPKTILFIEEKTSELYDVLGYGECTDSQYWEGMKHRGDDPLDRQMNPNIKWEKLLDQYWYSTRTHQKGYATMTVKVPDTFITDVAKLQEKLYATIEQAGIFIETNPTSNLMIGGFERYIDLPLFRFHTINGQGHKLPVSINTDDKGIFATSLKNEYSFVAVALRKEKDADGNRLWNDKEIVDYLRQIAYYGNLSRFSV